MQSHLPTRQNITCLSKPLPKSGNSVLTVMTPILGNLTYGNLIRKYLDESTELNVDFYWSTDERRLLDRILTRPFYVSAPNRWVRRQNLDIRKARAELAISYITRALLLKKLKARDYSAIHIHTQSISLLATDIMAKIPTVVSLDTTAVLASAEATDPPFRWTYRPSIQLEQRVFNSAHKIVTFSDYARQSVIQDYGIAPNKVHRIYPGVDTDKLLYEPEHRAAQASFERPASNLCKILFIGGDFKRKGGQDLLAVFLEQFADIAELHLVTRDSVDCDHPQVHVHYGIQSYTPAWQALYREADLFVMPTYAEALGHVFAEAMAVGLPVISTQLPAVAETVVHGETGLLVPPGDRQALASQIRNLLSNPSLRKKMGQRGYNRVIQFFDARYNFCQLSHLWQEAAS